MFPSALLFTSDRKEDISFYLSIYVPVVPSPSYGESSAHSIVCLEIGGWRETGVPSAVSALGPSGQCFAAALRTGIRCSVSWVHVEEVSVAGGEKYFMWRDVSSMQTLENCYFTG